MSTPDFLETAFNDQHDDVAGAPHPVQATGEERQDDIDTYRVKTMWAAVMERALDDLKGANDLNKSSALVWVQSDRYSENTFTGICETLKMDSESTRKRILANFESGDWPDPGDSETRQRRERAKGVFGIPSGGL